MPSGRIQTRKPSKPGPQTNAFDGAAAGVGNMTKILTEK
jgi:hypothetical protein